MRQPSCTGSLARIRKAIGQHAAIDRAAERQQDVARNIEAAVTSVSPGSAIIVSRPQSVNQWYPAIAV